MLSCILFKIHSAKTVFHCLKIIPFLAFASRAHLNKPHHMVPVCTVGVSVHQEFQASQEALDPRDQQVLRDPPAIMDLKDPWAHEERKAMKEPVEDKDFQAPGVTKVKQVPLVPRDPQAQLVPLGARVIQVLVEVKVPQVLRVLQDRLVVIGNSAFLISTMTRTLD